MTVGEMGKVPRETQQTSGNCLSLLPDLMYSWRENQHTGKLALKDCLGERLLGSFTALPTSVKQKISHISTQCCIYHILTFISKK